MNRSQNIFLGRPDTMLGICQAVGDDLGFNPNWLRLAFGIAILFNPLGVIAAYAALGVAVFASRLIWPPRPVAAPIKLVEPQAANDPAEQELALAA